MGSIAVIPHLYKSRPKVIEAMRYTGSQISKQKLESWLEDSFMTHRYEDVNSDIVDERDEKDKAFYIKTLEGPMRCIPGDFVIKGIRGEFYPCKEDIFKKTYEYDATQKSKPTRLEVKVEKG